MDTKAPDYIEEDDKFVHIPEGKFISLAEKVADYAAAEIRRKAFVAGDKGAFSKPLCSGCLAALASNVALLLGKKADKKFRWGFYVNVINTMKVAARQKRG